MKLLRYPTKKRLTLKELIFQKGEDPGLEEEENVIPDHFQEGEKEVSEMKGEEAKTGVAIGLILIGATLVRGEVRAEESSTETDKKDLKTGMNM